VQLTPEVPRAREGTEPAFTASTGTHEPGVYRRLLRRRAVRSFDSGSGWPSFWPTNGHRRSHFMRTEALCAAARTSAMSSRRAGADGTALLHQFASLKLEKK
jgi:peptide methionine sulfoxide reductase MsrB